VTAIKEAIFKELRPSRVLIPEKANMFDEDMYWFISRGKTSECILSVDQIHFVCTIESSFL
jgi:hypothetical protein